jgi:hypothetical protein
VLAAVNALQQSPLRPGVFDEVHHDVAQIAQLRGLSLRKVSEATGEGIKKKKSAKIDDRDEKKKKNEPHRRILSEPRAFRHAVGPIVEPPGSSRDGALAPRSPSPESRFFFRLARRDEETRLTDPSRPPPLPLSLSSALFLSRSWTASSTWT